MKATLISTSAFALIMAAALPTAVSAQTASTADANPAMQKGDVDAQTKPDIIVTGSRIARPEFSRPNPIQSFSAETIKDVGATNITDFLLRSPALLGSTKSSDTAG